MTDTAKKKPTKSAAPSSAEQKVESEEEIAAHNMKLLAQWKTQRAEEVETAKAERVAIAEDRRKKMREQADVERQERLAAAETRRKELREQSDAAKRAKIEAAEQIRRVPAPEDQTARIEKKKQERRQLVEQEQETARIASAEILPSPDSIEIARSRLHQNRTKSRIEALKKFALGVLLPTLLTAIYLFVFATPLYKSEAVFSVHTSTSSSDAGFPGMMGVGGFSDSLRDAFMVREHILSRSMMVQMEEQTGFVSHFKGDGIDPLTSSHASELLGTDDFADYQRRVSIGIDIQEGILRLYVDARTPEDSVRFANALLNNAEQRVNLLSEQMFADQVSLMQGNAKTAEQELQDARRSIIDLQIKHGELSPRDTVIAIHTSIQALEQKIKEAERIRDVQLQSNVKDSPMLARLTTEISVLSAQLHDQRNRLVDEEDVESLNNILAVFEYAGIQRDIAQQRWEFSLESLESSRQDALLQRRYLMVIAPPLLPDYPEKASHFRTILFTFLALATLFVAFSVFSAAVSARTRLQ